MAISTYGATWTALEEEFFPDAISDSARAGPDMADKAIEAIAGDVAVEIRGAGIRPEQITEEASPNAYRWLTRTILLGAAAHYGRTASHQTPEIYDAWSTEYDRRMGRLRGEPRSVLDDVPAFGGGADSYFAFA